MFLLFLMLLGIVIFIIAVSASSSDKPYEPLPPIIRNDTPTNHSLNTNITKPTAENFDVESFFNKLELNGYNSNQKGSVSNNTSPIIDLTVPDILMLSYADTFHTGENLFQQFWKFRYLVDADEVLDKLLQLDYICLGNYEATLNHKTVTELKTILRDYSLPLSGKKQDLIYRITDNLSSQQIETYCDRVYYTLTPKGKEILYQYPSVIYAHRHHDYYLSEKDILNNGKNIENIAFKKISNDMKSNILCNQWGLVRNSSFDLADISKDLENYSLSLKFLIIGACIDLSGITDRYAIEHQTAIPGENHCCMLYPFNVSRISDCISSLFLTNDEFAQRCSYIVDKFDLPYSYYSKKQLKEKIITSVLDFNEFKFK